MKKLNEYLPIKQAATFIGVTPNTLRNWEKTNKISVYRNPQNSYRLYAREDLEQLLEKIQSKVMP